VMGIYEYISPITILLPITHIKNQEPDCVVVGEQKDI
jgi:hypothetical protein